MTYTKASLNLSFELQKDQTILRVRKQEPPLRVIRAFPIEIGANTNGQIKSQKDPKLFNESDHNGYLANNHLTSRNPNQNDQSKQRQDLEAEAMVKPTLVHLHNVSGGLLGGDQLGLEATIGSKAQAQITTTGATRVYRYRQNNLITTQTTRLTVESNGLLEYLPDTLIPYARSQYRQTTRIELAQGAGLFYWEVVTPGREAKGECFDYKLLQIELDIMAEDQPIAIERYRLEPARLSLASSNVGISGFESLIRLGGYRYFASFYICKVGLEPQRWLDLEAQLDAMARTISTEGQMLWGVSMLPAHGLSVRAVGTSSHAIQQALPQFWRLAKEELYRQPAVMPRKMY